MPGIEPWAIRMVHQRSDHGASRSEVIWQQSVWCQKVVEEDQKGTTPSLPISSHLKRKYVRQSCQIYVQSKPTIRRLGSVILLFLRYARGEGQKSVERHMNQVVLPSMWRCMRYVAQVALFRMVVDVPEDFRDLNLKQTCCFMSKLAQNLEPVQECN